MSSWEMEESETRQKTILKKQKSLPLTKSKNVHFADVCGLSLVSVHKISMDDLTVPSNSDLKYEITKELTVNFAQPIAQPNFVERLNRLSVSLENVVVSNCALMGTIKVRNITYEKLVFVRCSFDNWKSFEDVNGSYVPLSYDGNFDRFSFAITVPNTIKNGEKIEFAVCYRTTSPDNEFWDNNDNKNYIIECKEKPMPRNSSYGLLWSRIIPNYKT
ncbi:protein phosphatase 1 regulatory subunit 3B-B-like [Dendronephthya gigantea]|uniref:protein phosphatase 1 regulatory subunit 3B-B-like n=1 Tax=Dendronephthya gigantea TaxID=151771 RepID=UPI00106BF5F4|nr:protein phosphatase 1 regulatory subunit 3B-B-like [Dendronephthya gigantea]